ncbi:Glucuronosyltransferase [Aphelenchoides besseyi]|nr:Glucuronosyltransferase [Aphelenchoides besseyi]
MRLLFTFCVLAFTTVESLKILLFYQLLGKSHINFAHAASRVLVEKGHIVDVVVSEWSSKIATDDLKPARRVIRVRHSNATAFELIYGNLNVMEHVQLKSDHECFTRTAAELCRTLVSKQSLIEELKAEKYDLGLTALFDGCGLGLFHLLGIPAAVGYSPTAEAYGMRGILGYPSPPSFVSDIENHDLQGDQFTLKERVHNFLYSTGSLGDSVNEPLQPVFDELYTGFPQVSELYKNLNFIFLNTHELLAMPKPISSKIKFIGGLALKRPIKHNSLPPDVEKAINQGSDGFVLFSFGTYARTSLIDKTTKEAVVKAFKRFPSFSFLWKFDDLDEDVELFKEGSNIHRFKWLPQIDLLTDNRIRAFISHSGQNSYMEASQSSSGVPLVSIPLFADQFYNAACVERNGQGVQISKLNITEESLFEALNSVLYDKSFSTNAKRLALAIERYPNDPKETFVRYIELSAEFPELGERSRLASDNMHWFVYFSFDVVLVFILTALFVVVSAVIVFKLPSYLLRKARQQKVKSKNN